MVRIPAGIHKKTKHTNLETAANAACVNECTCYWAFTEQTPPAKFRIKINPCKHSVYKGL